MKNSYLSESDLEELVVLVNKADQPIGTLPKSAVHTVHTPLHRGFSLFLFNSKGEVLLQQRSHLKKTWPLVWAGSCCGHPLPDESGEQAVRRRAQFELGLRQIDDLELLLPDFRYTCLRDGIRENEICPVWVGRTLQNPEVNSTEIETWRWQDWPSLVQEITTYPGRYAEWCEEEVILLHALPAFQSYLQ